MTRTLNAASETALADRVANAASASFDYDYALNLDLRPFRKGPNSVHDFIRDEILIRSRESHSYISQFFNEWKKLDRNVTAFVPTDVKEKNVLAQDDRKPVSIVIPQSYAILETLLTYFTTTFIQDTIHTYSGVGPEDVPGAMLLEQHVRQQSRRFKEDLSLYVQARSSFLHGIGVAVSEWGTIEGMRPRTEVVDSILADLFGLRANEGDMIRGFESATLFQGTKWRNIDSYNYLPDPKYPPHRIQDGEFIGWTVRTTIQDLLFREADPKNGLVNAKYLRLVKGAKRSSLFGEAGVTGRLDRYSSSSGTTDDESLVDVINMYIKIIPREWGLGEGTIPEMWFFAVAGDMVVVAAEPARFAHGQFPVTVMAPNMDGYEAIPVSNIAVTFGMQQLIDWLMNAHVANVRKAINTMLVVDPSAVELDDLRNPSPGKFIRLKRNFYGEGKIDQWIKQLDVTDVTRGHMADLGIIQQIMQNTAGASDIVQGLMKGLPDRPTEQGLATATNLALSKLQKMARISGSMAFRDAAWQMGFNTQQFVDDRFYIDVIGRNEEELREIFELGPTDTRVPVTPDDISIAFDVEDHDGSNPQQSQASFWNNQVLALMNSEVGASEIFSKLDPVRIYLHAARLNGVTNARDLFRRPAQPTVLPDEEVARQEASGQLIGVQ